MRLQSWLWFLKLKVGCSTYVLCVKVECFGLNFKVQVIILKVESESWIINNKCWNVKLKVDGYWTPYITNATQVFEILMYLPLSVWPAKLMMVLHNSNLITSNLVTNFILLWFNKYKTKSYKLKTSIDQIQNVPTPLLGTFRSGAMEATGVVPAEDLSLKRHQTI